MHAAIDIKGLKKTYKNGAEALKGIDLKVQEGDFFALLGANGAGKSTLIGILTSIVTKSAGQVKVFGLDLDQDLERAKQYIGVVPQEFNFSIFEKVLDIVVCQAGYFGIPRKKALEEAEKILKKLDLWEKRDKASRTLSGGMKRRLMIARALVHQPKLLILDEPTAGVDVELRRGMWDYLNQLNREGTTILLTTHYLEEVEQMCRNVAILKQGEIVREGSVKSILASVEKESYLVEYHLEAGHDMPTTEEAFRKEGFDLCVVEPGSLEVDFHKEKTLHDFMQIAQNNGLRLEALRPKGNRLEQLFLNILKEEEPVRK